MPNLRTFIFFYSYNVACLHVAPFQPRISDFIMQCCSQAVTDLIKGLIILLPLITNTFGDQYAFHTGRTSQETQSPVSCILYEIKQLEVSMN